MRPFHNCQQAHIGSVSKAISNKPKPHSKPNLGTIQNNVSFSPISVILPKETGEISSIIFTLLVEYEESLRNSAILSEIFIKLCGFDDQ